MTFVNATLYAWAEAAAGLLAQIKWIKSLKPSKWIAPFATGLQSPLVTHAELSDIAARVAAARAAARSGKLVEYRHPGESRSVHLGMGLDFEESRRYVRGDDVRHMDWRVTARTGQPHVKVYREAHQPGLHLVIDLGAGMRFGTHRRLKAAQSVRVAAFFAFGAAPENTPMSATLWQPEEITILAGTGERGAMHLLSLANQPCPPLGKAAAARQRPLAQVLGQLAQSLPRGVRIVLLSDFSQLDEAASAALARLAAHYNITAVQILDTAETALPDVGLAPFESCDSKATCWIDTTSATVRSGFQQRARQQHDAQQAALSKAGAQFFRILAQDDGLALLTWISHHGHHAK